MQKESKPTVNKSNINNAESTDGESAASTTSGLLGGDLGSGTSDVNGREKFHVRSEDRRSANHTAASDAADGETESDHDASGGPSRATRCGQGGSTADSSSAGDSVGGIDESGASDTLIRAEVLRNDASGLTVISGGQTMSISKHVVADASTSGMSLKVEDKIRVPVFENTDALDVGQR